MNNKTRIIVNTLAQNVRSIVNIILSLYSTRIVMDALGVSDYGIYMLVAGVVSLLNFFTNSLTLTTQRHISYCHGAGRKDEARIYFANSYLLLLIIGIVLVVIFAITEGTKSDVNYTYEEFVLDLEEGKVEKVKFVRNEEVPTGKIVVTFNNGDKKATAYVSDTAVVENVIISAIM